MRVRDWMTSEVHACRPEDRLEEAARLLWDHDCGIVPVVEQGEKLVGVITDRDICMAAYTRGAALRELSVASTMAQDVETCRPDEELQSALARMQARRLRRLPAVDAEGRLTGMLSFSDVVRAWKAEPRQNLPRISAQELAKTLAAIVQPRAAEAAKPQASSSGAVPTCIACTSEPQSAPVLTKVSG